MEVFLSLLVPVGVPLLIAITIVIILANGYIKAPPDQAFLISGLRKEPRIVIARASVKIPFFERVDKLFLGMIPIDVKTKSSVPTKEFINVNIDANVNVRIGTDPAAIKIASQNFLGQNREVIADKVRELLEGNIREIIGQMGLREMVSDRIAFSEKVKENAIPDLERLGLELVSFNVQNFKDDNGVIDNLGVDNVEQIRKQASIAKSDAKREVAIAEAENAKKANDANVQAQTEIAQKNAELETRQAELKTSVDAQKAAADSAYQIQENEQLKAVNTSRVNAEIAQREREVELKQREIELKERELDATVRKQAEADKYEAQLKAEAELVRRQKDAEAKRYETEQQAQAQKSKADADRYAAEQQAIAISAVGEAEALAIEKKAEAQKKMGEASVLEMYFKAMPSIVSAAAAPLSKVDSITMYGEGNSGKLVGDVMKTTDKVMEGLAGAGVDIQSILSKFLSKEEIK